MYLHYMGKEGKKV